MSVYVADLVPHRIDQLAVRPRTWAPFFRFTLPTNTVQVWEDGGPSFDQLSSTGIISLSAGFEHVLAARADGTLFSSGGNTFGQTSLPSGLTNVVMVAAGYSHSLALQRDGSLTGWGDNFSGQITIHDD